MIQCVGRERNSIHYIHAYKPQIWLWWTNGKLCSAVQHGSIVHVLCAHCSAARSLNSNTQQQSRKMAKRFLTFLRYDACNELIARSTCFYFTHCDIIIISLIGVVVIFFFFLTHSLFFSLISRSSNACSLAHTIDACWVFFSVCHFLLLLPLLHLFTYDSCTHFHTHTLSLFLLSSLQTPLCAIFILVMRLSFFALILYTLY